MKRMKFSNRYANVIVCRGIFHVQMRCIGHDLKLGSYSDRALADSVHQYAHRQLWHQFSILGQGEISLPAAVKVLVDKAISELRDVFRAEYDAVPKPFLSQLDMFSSIATNSV